MSTENKTLWSKLSDAAKAGYEVLKTEMAALKVEMNETPATPVKMGESALQDGTVIKYTGDTLAEGSEIIIVAADGSGEIPAPEGDHILQDGSTITVSIQDGKSIVTAVKPAAAPEEMKSEEAKQVSERVTKIVEKFIALEKSFEAKFKAQEIQIENLKLKLGKVSAGVLANHNMLVEFGAIPMANAIEEPATETGKAMSKKEKLIEKFKTK